MTDSSKYKILCVGDEVEFLDFICQQVSSLGFETLAANSVDEAVAVLKKRSRRNCSDNL